MFVNMWLNKQLTVYPYDERLSNKKKWAIYTCDAMDESQNNYAEWKKPDNSNTDFMTPFI